jgi:hypothetical protein
MSIDNLTIKEAKELAAMFGGLTQAANDSLKNPLLGQRVLVRTYSAGVHIGTLAAATGTECHLKDALRLWKWEGGGLSLSAVATNGIVKGRLNRTPEVFLTNCIEYIPTTKSAEKTFEKFVEDEK